ncbi:hypothetical protein T265_10449 [Opisthorchis viverrini]|uniref:Uncharacterized protein n=1 Tax=Opisthorchis viverrini TaxID=6198 RepID=A0A074Z6L2_OPIVI|nr:hypothetical protein T265_10449 [Opisthorchis viverrini]KER21172.1 hypothetical protein T265_10449 [Opisthorchis viverrini]
MFCLDSAESSVKTKLLYTGQIALRRNLVSHETLSGTGLHQKQAIEGSPPGKQNQRLSEKLSTVRELHIGIGEHSRKNRPPRNADEYQALLEDSAIAEHALDTGHKTDLENTYPAESLGFDVSRQLNVLHQATSCFSYYDVRNRRRGTGKGVENGLGSIEVTRVGVRSSEGGVVIIWIPLNLTHPLPKLCNIHMPTKIRGNLTEAPERPCGCHLILVVTRLLTSPLLQYEKSPVLSNKGDSDRKRLHTDTLTQQRMISSLKAHLQKALSNEDIHSVRNCSTSSLMK